MEDAAYYARELALDTLPATKFTAAEDAERKERLPNSPKSQELQTKLALRAAVRSNTEADIRR
jgi:hypothetical protein